MEDYFSPEISTVPVEPDLLRQAMRFWTTGVTVVSAKHNGVAHGMTVSSFTSVSLKPPQVLISLAQDSRTHALVKGSRIFGVTVLSTAQQDISDRFAGRIADDLDRMGGLKTFTLTTGVPLLEGGIAHFDCRVIATFSSGTHTIFIGEVLAARYEESGEPLLYFNRGYHKMDD
jgi:flavin reductase (DIM6/NTAB) family NADH-FMN oxidoreductase RutF